MKLIVGLGNPGAKYENNRHNFGFKVVEALSRDLKSSFKKNSSFACLVSEVSIAGEKVLLVKPQVFMNLSGRAVGALVEKKKVALRDLIVVYDDVSLDFGVIRLRPAGSSGGHNGTANIIKELGASGFARLRLGIKGEFLKDADLSRYVLADFTKSEKAGLKHIIDNARNCLEVWVRSGITEAMNKFNGTPRAKRYCAGVH